MTEPKTRVIQRDITQVWAQCYACDGDGKLRPVITQHTERTSPSALTALFWVQRGPAVDRPCDNCDGEGGWWENDD